MSLITSKINIILDDKNLTHYKLSKLMDFPEGALGMMINAKSPFSEKAIKKLLPILEVSKQEFESWILADKYPKEILELAMEAKKIKNKDKKLILTAKIDELLEVKGISRTAFSKHIKYSQSTFNNAITGKESLSKNLMAKISEALEVPVERIQAWVLADKYSTKVLKLAYEV